MIAVLASLIIVLILYCRIWACIYHTTQHPLIKKIQILKDKTGKMNQNENMISSTVVTRTRIRKRKRLYLRDLKHAKKMKHET